MSEKPKGIEALNNLPISDTLYSIDEAMAKLTPRTQVALRSNIAQLREILLKNGEDPTQLDSFDTNVEGGFSLSRQDYIEILRSNPHQSFRVLSEAFVEEIFPIFFNDEEHPREPGVTCMGYILDLLDCIDPKVASYNEGVEIIIETFQRSQHYDLFLLGAMIDDSRKQVSKSGIPDVFMDPEAVEKFMKSLYPKLNKDQKLELDAGINISINDLNFYLFGNTLN